MGNLNEDFFKRIDESTNSVLNNIGANELANPVADQKKIRLIDSLLRKKEKIDPRYEKSDDIRFQFQDSINKGKSLWNTIAPSSMEMDKYELDNEGKAWLLDRDTDEKLSRVEINEDDNKIYGLKVDDGDTINGKRLPGIDTPESIYMPDGKFQRLADDYGVKQSDQIEAGNIAKKAGENWILEHPFTEAAYKGKGYYGRDLYQADEYNMYMVSNGYAVPSADADPKLLKAYQYAKQNKLGLHGKYSHTMDAMEVDANRYKNDLKYGKEDTLELIDSFKAGSVSAVGNLLALAGEALDGGSKKDGWLEKYGKNLKNNANEIAGYNDASLKRAELKSRRSLADLKRGDTVSAIGNSLGAMWESGPQTISGSLPQLIEFAAVSAGTSAATLNPFAGFFAGMATIGAINANEELDEREKLNGGRKATFKEIAAVTTAEAIAAGLDYGAFEFIVSGKTIKALIKGADKAVDINKIFQLTNKTRKLELAKALGRSVLRGEAAGMEESVQETATEVIRTLAKEYGTDAYKDETLSQFMNRNQENFYTSAVLGHGGGIGFGLGSNALKTGKEIKNINNEFNGLDKADKAGRFVGSKQEAQDALDIGQVDLDGLIGETQELANDNEFISKSNNIDDIIKRVDASNLHPETKSILMQEFELLKESQQNDGKEIDLNDVKNSVNKIFSKTIDKAAQKGRELKTFMKQAKTRLDSNELIDDIDRSSVVLNDNLNDVSDTTTDASNYNSEDKATGNNNENVKFNEDVGPEPQAEWNTQTPKVTTETTNEVNQESDMYSDPENEYHKKVSDYAASIINRLNKSKMKAEKAIKKAQNAIDSKKKANKKPTKKSLKMLNDNKKILLSIENRINKANSYSTNNKVFDSYLKSIKQSEIDSDFSNQERIDNETINTHKINNDKKLKEWNDKKDKLYSAKENAEISLYNAENNFGKDSFEYNEALGELEFVNSELKKNRRPKTIDTDKLSKELKNKRLESKKIKEDNESKRISDNKEKLLAKKNKQKFDKLSKKYKNKKRIPKSKLDAIEKKIKSLSIKLAKSKNDKDIKLYAKIKKDIKTLIDSKRRINKNNKSLGKEFDEYISMSKDFEDTSKDIKNKASNTKDKTTETQNKDKSEKQSKQKDKSENDTVKSEAKDKRSKSEISKEKKERQEKQDEANSEKLSNEIKKQLDAIGLINLIAPTKMLINKKEAKKILIDTLSKLSLESLNKINSENGYTLFDQKYINKNNNAYFSHREIKSVINEVIKSRNDSKEIIKIGKDIYGIDSLSNDINDIVQPLISARNKILNEKDSLSENDIKDLSKIMNDAFVNISSYIEKMSRAEFDKFINGKMYDKIYDKFGFDEFMDFTLLARNEKYTNIVKGIIKNRISKESTIRSKKKFVSDIARSSSVVNKEDITLAREIIKELTDNNKFTEEQSLRFNKMLDKVLLASEENIEKIKKAKKDKLQKKVDEKLKTMSEEEKLPFNNMNTSVAAQLFGLTGFDANAISDAKIYGLKIDYDLNEVIIEADCK